jgi:hypothetical protein
MMTSLIPKIFYEKMEDGLSLFVTCLGFTILHQDETLAVVKREGAKAYLMQDAELASKDRPEITIETDDADALYAEISAKAPEMLHPNAKVVALKPWGSREFAVLDLTGVCVIFRQW